MSDPRVESVREAFADFERSAATRGRSRAKQTRAVRATETPRTLDEVARAGEPAGVDSGTRPGSALVLVVPMPPTLTNSGAGRSRHWRVLEREKAGYWMELDLTQRITARQPTPNGFTIPPAPATPLARVTLTSHMTLGGHMDDDNALARHKWLVDWLVRRGYLVSDRRTCVRWAALPTQHVTRKAVPRIALTIQPDEP